jgi:hypothetical protein
VDGPGDVDDNITDKVDFDGESNYGDVKEKGESADDYDMIMSLMMIAMKMVII